MEAAAAARRLARVVGHVVGCSAGVVVVRPPPDNVTNVPLNYSYEFNELICVSLAGSLPDADCVV